MREYTPPYRFPDAFRDQEFYRWLAKPDQLGALPPELTAEYRSWRKIRPIADGLGLDPNGVWAMLGLGRQHGRRYLPLMQADGRQFHVCLGPHLFEPLHRIDRATGGGGPAALLADDGVLSDGAHHQRLRIQTLMDEAAQSSIIEGAARTHKQAIEMLRSGREPADKHERMIYNNYVAMQRIKKLVDKPATVEMLLELQSILIDGTLDDPGERGRFRRPDEDVRVVDSRDGSTVYTPPSAVGLEARVRAICDFANTKFEGQKFLHPILHAAILHFMIGYEHPFCDGNGRTARAMFYWRALRDGYTIFEYIPISERIRASFTRYRDAYLDTEHDDGDVTYFVLYQLDVIEQSLDHLAKYLGNEERKIKDAERLIKLSKDLNLRQRLLLSHALRHPTQIYTVKSHMNSNGITPVTARADLEGLAKHRLMVRSKRGKEVLYHPAPGLKARVEKKRK